MRQFMADVDYACRLLKGEDPKKYILPKLAIMETPGDIEWLADEISKHPYCAADTETGGYSGFDFTRDRILCSGYCVEPGVVYVVPEDLVQFTGKIFEKAKNTRFIWHNGKYDVKFHLQQGIPARVDEDTMLLSYALEEIGGLHDLEQVASDLIGAPDWKFMIKEYTIGKDAQGRPKTYDAIPRPILHDYMARDISATLQIFPILRNQVRRNANLEKLYTRTLLPYSAYLTKIEMRGMCPDTDQVASNQKEMQARATLLEKWFNRIAILSGHGALNPRSPIQVSAFLYDTLGLRDPRKAKARPTSTDEKTLGTLQPHKAVKTLLRYREVQKGLSTYVNSVEDNIGADGRIHTTYLIHGTTSGRLASREPNLLNIPRDPALRNQFKAGPGRRLVEIDVSQAELRVLAELSRDPVLIKIYNTKGMSIHKTTQHAMYGDPAEYSDDAIRYYMDKFNVASLERALDEQNMRAKTVNFGIVYGRTAPSIAEEFRITVPEATDWIKAWFAKYPKAHEFIQACRMAPVRGHNLVTPFGRMRRFLCVSPEKLNDIQNQAANFPMQSIAADCVFHTGLLVQDEAKERWDADIVNTVYDSLLFDLPDDDQMTWELGTFVLSTLRKVPRQWGLTSVPFEGDLKVGRSWGDTKKSPLPKEYQAIVDAS